MTDDQTPRTPPQPLLHDAVVALRAPTQVWSAPTARWAARADRRASTSPTSASWRALRRHASAASRRAHRDARRRRRSSRALRRAAPRASTATAPTPTRAPSLQRDGPTAGGPTELISTRARRARSVTEVVVALDRRPLADGGGEGGPRATGRRRPSVDGDPRLVGDGIAGAALDRAGAPRSPPTVTRSGCRGRVDVPAHGSVDGRLPSIATTDAAAVVARRPRRRRRGRRPTVAGADDRGSPRW